MAKGCAYSSYYHAQFSGVIGEGWTGNARTVRVPVCINHPILYIWDFWKVYYCIIRDNLEHFSP